VVHDREKQGSSYEEDIPPGTIAESIGRSLSVPSFAKSRVKTAKHFPWLALLISADNPHPASEPNYRRGGDSLSPNGWLI
jgi:hypothetical protein